MFRKKILMKISTNRSDLLCNNNPTRPKMKTKIKILMIISMLLCMLIVIHTVFIIYKF